MKKMIALSLAVILAFALSACSTVNFEKVKDEFDSKTNTSLLKKAEDLGVDVDALATEAELLDVDPTVNAYNEDTFSEWFPRLYSEKRDQYNYNLQMSELYDYYSDIDISILVSYDGKSMTVSDYSIFHIRNMNDRLGLPSSLTSKIEMTDEDDGMQSETQKGITVTWSCEEKYIGDYWTVIYEK